jgi:2-polyprenyl-3-methyl-5-hydroxy-6-metoxy-1,4-benzoquinol methylase
MKRNININYSRLKNSSKIPQLHPEISEGFSGMISRFRLGKFLLSRYREACYKNRFKKVIKFKRKGNILDIGCAQGNFLAYFKTSDWNITGIEINKHLSRIARNKLPEGRIINLPVEFYHSAKDQFDIITFWHVFEHLSCPDKIIKMAYTLLKKDGYLIIEIPNGDSIYFHWFGENWQLFMPKEHLFLWTHKSLGHLLNIHRFKIIEIKYPGFMSSLPSSLIQLLIKSGYPKRLAKIIGLVSIPLAVIMNLFFRKQKDNLLMIAQKITV